MNLDQLKELCEKAHTMSLDDFAEVACHALPLLIDVAEALKEWREWGGDESQLTLRIAADRLEREL